MTVKRNFEQVSNGDVLTCYINDKKQLYIQLGDSDDMMRCCFTTMDKEDLSLFIQELKDLMEDM